MKVTPKKIKTFLEKKAIEWYPHGKPEGMTDREFLDEFHRRIKQNTTEQKDKLDRFFGMLDEHEATREV